MTRPTVTLPLDLDDITELDLDRGYADYGNCTVYVVHSDRDGRESVRVIRVRAPMVEFHGRARDRITTPLL